MKNLKLLLLAIVTTFSFSSCEDEVEALGTPYVAFEAQTIDIGVDPGGSTSKDIKIYAANISSSARTIGVSVIADLTTADPSAYSVPASINIPADSNEGILTVEVQDINLDEAKNLVLNLDQTAEIFAGDPITITIRQVCPLNEVILSITFDTWPEEIYWSIVDDATDTVVAESLTPAAFGAYAGLTGGITEKFCLPDGSYTFNIFDAYSDGGGPVSLSFNGATIFNSDGSYGASTSGSFTLP